jgi:hypothetical protein
MASTAHPELHLLHKNLQNIYDALLNFRPLAGVPPILDSSVDADPNDDGQWLRHENIPGIKKLRESIKFDIDILEKACLVSLHIYTSCSCCGKTVVSFKSCV